MTDKPAATHARRGRTRPRWLAVAPETSEDVPVGPPEVDALLDRLADLSARASTLYLEEVGAVLDATVALALATFPGVDAAGIITMNRARAVTATAPSGDLAGRLDVCQAVLIEGPGVDALAAGATAAPGTTASEDISRSVEVVDLRTGAGAAARWPRFAAEAQRLGVGAMLALPLRVDVGSARRPAPDPPTHGLTLYGPDPSAITPTDRVLACALASQAALALGAARRLYSLNEALRTRDVIGQAKGILVQRHGLDPEAAFARLVTASQHANLKLRDVAVWLVDEAVSGSSP